MTLLYKIIYLVVCSVLSINAEALEDTSAEQVESSSESTRNARYINFKPGGYYPSTGAGGGGYYYPNVNQYPGGGSTSFYPDNRYPTYPNKLDPNYWFNKIPGVPTTSYPQGGGYYPNTNPGYYPQGGTNWIGYNPGNRYPGNYPTGSGYYPGTGSGYYPPTGGNPFGNGGYGGYQGNGGFPTYSGYDGYYNAGNRPGNIGFGYQNSRRTGIVSGLGGFGGTLSPIVTPSSVSKDAK